MLFLNRLLQLSLLLAFSLLLQFLYDDEEMRFWPQWAAWILVVSFCAIAARIATRRLVPRLLYHQRKGAFVAAILGLALLNSIVTYIIAGTIYLWLANEDGLFTGLTYFLYMCGFFFVANVVVISVACALKIVTDRFRLEERVKEIEQEKTSAELSFLRAQVNPHFLFNILNTIYFQIRQDNVAARRTVEQFSELLRYQLYECSTDAVDIAQEISFLKSYTAIQQLRLEQGTRISLDISPDLPSFRIAPLLLMPLVENAFKHISHFKNPPDNQLSMTLCHPQPGTFQITICNTFNAQEETRHLLQSGGLGLQNVRRRLELLYPGRHSLEATQHDHFFTTNLRLNYGDELPGGR